MKEKPILFNGDMVRAILSGEKTQTRRPIRPQPTDGSTFGVLGVLSEKKSHKFIEKGNTAVFHESRDKWIDDDHPHAIFCSCPFGKVGDRLWVRETFAYCQLSSDITGEYYTDSIPKKKYKRDCKFLNSFHITYKADDEDPISGSWRPSIHMPRWASRINLQITDIRVERVQDISEEDAESEGVDFLRHIPDADETLTAKELFSMLWNACYRKRGFGSNENPWVWVVSFKRIL